MPSESAPVPPPNYSPGASWSSSECESVVPRAQQKLKPVPKQNAPARSASSKSSAQPKTASSKPAAQPKPPAKRPPPPQRKQTAPAIPDTRSAVPRPLWAPPARGSEDIDFEDCLRRRTRKKRAVETDYGVTGIWNDNVPTPPSSPSSPPPSL